MDRYLSLRQDRDGGPSATTSEGSVAAAPSSLKSKGGRPKSYVRDLYFTDVAASVGAKKNNGRCTFCGIVVEGKVSILETHILQCKQAPEEAKDTVRDRAEAADTPEPGASCTSFKGCLA